MNAQRQAGGGGYPGGNSRPPLSKKEQKELKKKQVRSELAVPGTEVGWKAWKVAGKAAKVGLSWKGRPAT